VELSLFDPLMDDFDWFGKDGISCLVFKDGHSCWVLYCIVEELLDMCLIIGVLLVMEVHVVFHLHIQYEFPEELNHFCIEVSSIGLL